MLLQTTQTFLTEILQKWTPEYLKLGFFFLHTLRNKFSKPDF